MMLQEYLRILRERWVMIVAAVLVAGVAAGAAWYLWPKEYTASLTLYVSAQTADSTQTAYQGAQLSQQRVTPYAELVSSERVATDVGRELGLVGAPAELARRITASSALDSVLIDVAVTDPAPAQAAAIANAVGRAMTNLVAELERPSTPGAVPAVAIRVVQDAAVPTAPSSTSLPVALALGVLAGLGLGIAAALARNALDTSVTSPEQLRAAVDAPNLGTIAYDAGVPAHPLTVHDDPHSPRAEAFRQLRTNLQFVDVDQPHKVIVVTSSLPGEGKSTTLANLAIALASAGQRVLAIEADLRRPKLADMLGLERAVGLTSILSGRVRPEQAVQHWQGGVDVIASGALPANPSELLASRQMASLLAELRRQYDVILVDSPPLLPVTDAAAVVPATDGALLICRYKATKRGQAGAAAAALEAVSARLLGTVFTMVPSAGPRAYARYHSYYHPAEGTDVPQSPPVGNPSVRPSPVQRDVPPTEPVRQQPRHSLPGPRADRR